MNQTINEPRNTPERKLYVRLKNALIRGRVGIDIERLEVTSMSGVPDVNVCFNGVETWIELKIITQGQVLLRPFQYAWGMRRASCGGRSYVVASPTDQLGIVFLWKFPIPEVIFDSKYVRLSKVDKVYYKPETKTLVAELLGLS